MEQNNLLEYLYKRLKNDKLWFVTKNDVSSSWENKPKKYYALDEYGEIKDKSKVEKEINDYIGDGAETIQEAVSLFIADKVCDGSITTTNYLTTEFKDKPVEYTDTAVEVKNVEPKYIKLEITGSNKQVESKQLKKENSENESEFDYYNGVTNLFYYLWNNPNTSKRVLNWLNNHDDIGIVASENNNFWFETPATYDAGFTDKAHDMLVKEIKRLYPNLKYLYEDMNKKQEDIFDDVSNGKATYGVYDDKDTRNYKDRYKEPTYAKRNKIRNFKDDKFKQRSVRDIINKGVTHVDYEKMPNERVQAYKNSKKEEDKEFIPDEMEDYKKSYIDKYHKIPKKMEWKYMAGDVDGIKIDGKIYIFNIDTKKCLGTFDEFKSNDFKTESVKDIGNIQRRLDESSLNDIANYIKGIVDYDVNITPTEKGFSSYDVNFLNTDDSIMYSVVVNDFAMNDKVILLNTLIIVLDRLYRGKTFADIIRERLLDELNKIHPINKKIENVQRRLEEENSLNIHTFKKINEPIRHKGLKNKLKDFYNKAFNDSLGNDINPNATFLDLYRALKNKDDVYDLIGVGDSVIRERLFYELADILNQNVKYVYDLWKTGAYDGHPGIIKESVQRRLEEENNKSLNLISDMFKSKDFDSDSKAGQIVMRTSSLFNALSDKGYDVQVSFDNGESTNTILLGQQGGSILITINNTNQPLRAFTDGSFEITEDNIKILDDVRKEIETI